MMILSYNRLLVFTFVPIVFSCNVVTSTAYSSHNMNVVVKAAKKDSQSIPGRHIQVKSIKDASFSRRSLVATFIGTLFSVVGTNTATASGDKENPGVGSLATADLSPCKANSRSCVQARWITPPGTTKSAALKELRDVLQLYPQVGQSGVDCNGWSIARDNLADDGGMDVEYKSCIGPAAISINLGRPFVDDVQLKMLDVTNLDGSTSPNIIVDVKSRSRMGSSDYGVNKKRINWLANELRARGWDAPKASYAVPSYDALF